MKILMIPEGHFKTPQPSEEDAAARKRRELREKLLRGEEVVVTQEGQVGDKNQQEPNKPAIIVPEGKLAESPRGDEDAAAQKRRELREKLLRGEEVVVTQEGQVTDKNRQDPKKPAIVVPEGKLAETVLATDHIENMNRVQISIVVPTDMEQRLQGIEINLRLTLDRVSQNSDDEHARVKRRELREKLLRGELVVVKDEGDNISTEPTDSHKPVIIVPEGNLGASFYWYERNPELLQGEREAMSHFFPQFKLEKLGDGRLSWIGLLTPSNVRKNAKWYLQVIYDNNHPNNNTYGGSIKVYSIEPNLEEIIQQLRQPIPHTLRDGSGHLYLCTARPEDVRVGLLSTSAASALSWAAKWITVFELWLAGDITTDEFRGHNI